MKIRIEGKNRFKTKMVLLYILILVFSSTGIQTFGQTNNNPTLLDFTEIQTQKNRIVEKEPEAQSFYNSLIEKANKALNAGPFSVMDKKQCSTKWR